MQKGFLLRILLKSFENNVSKKVLFGTITGAWCLALWYFSISSVPIQLYFIAAIPAFFFVGYFIINWKVEYLLIIAFTASINFFGIYTAMSIPHIKLPGMGTFHLRDLLLIITFLVSVYSWSGLKNLESKTGIGTLLVILLIITAFEIAMSLFFYGVTIHMVMRGLRQVAYFLMFFCVVTLIRNRKQFDRVFTGLYCIAGITSLIGIFQALFGISFSASRAEAMYGLDYYRVYQHGMILQVFCLIIFASELLSQKIDCIKNLFLKTLLLILMIFGVVVVFYRSVLFNTLLVIFLLLSIHLRKNLKQLLVLLIVGFFLAFFTNHLFMSTGKSSILKTAKIRMSSGLDDLYTDGGTFRDRYNFMVKKMNYVWSRNFLTGIGFSGIRDYNISDKQVHHLPDSLTADNSIANIFILYGLSGLVWLSCLMVTVFTTSIKLMRRINHTTDRARLWGILAFNIFIVLQCFFTDLFNRPSNLTIIAASWGFIEVINLFSKEQVPLYKTFDRNAGYMKPDNRSHQCIHYRRN